MICNSLPTCVPCLPPMGMSCQTDGVFVILSSKARSLYMLQGQKYPSLLLILTRGRVQELMWLSKRSIFESLLLLYSTCKVGLQSVFFNNGWIVHFYAKNVINVSYFNNLYHKTSMASEIYYSQKTIRLCKIRSKLTIRSMLMTSNNIFIFSSVFFGEFLLNDMSRRKLAEFYVGHELQNL